MKITKIFNKILILACIFLTFLTQTAYSDTNGSVYIDAGHGGSDSGAVDEQDLEKDWNLDTARACVKELEKHGVKVYVSRDDDRYISLKERYESANDKNVDYFISIHHNAGGGDRGEVIYSIKSKASKELAENIKEELLNINQDKVNVYNRLNSSGTDYYAVLRGSDSPSVIVEVCFMDNKKDRLLADSKEERERNGRIIARGILKQMNIKYEQEKKMEENNTKPVENKLDKKEDKPINRLDWLKNILKRSDK